MVRKRFQNVQIGHITTSNLENSGQPIEATSQETIDKIYHVMDDSRFEIHVVMLVLWISQINE